ncbi:MAG: glycosyl transferase family 2, partial [Lachnospiraceae bacterium]|nr:glycosyl transferase family 2 [Lachnospiraceae bacterium]
NNDTEVISPGAVRSMVFYAMQEGVGAVGAKLLYGDNTIQHAGVTVGVEGRVIHLYLGTPEDQPGYMGRLVSTLEVSAVTGACLMSKKALYDEVSGMTEEFTVAYNDVDYCLKLQQKGYRCVYDAYAKLYHYESKSRGYEDTKEKQERLQKEMDLLVSRWPDRMKRDPYYNDNLSLKRGFCLLP